LILNVDGKVFLLPFLFNYNIWISLLWVGSFFQGDCLFDSKQSFFEGLSGL
jgi:hypothetical protein